MNVDLFAKIDEHDLHLSVKVQITAAIKKTGATLYLHHQSQ